jgi:hypothetical protein
VNGHEDIENVRLVRDSATLIGKGIGYALFKTRDAVFRVLELNKVHLSALLMFPWN